MSVQDQLADLAERGIGLPAAVRIRGPQAVAEWSAEQYDRIAEEAEREADRAEESADASEAGSPAAAEMLGEAEEKRVAALSVREQADAIRRSAPDYEEISTAGVPPEAVPGLAEFAGQEGGPMIVTKEAAEYGVSVYVDHIEATRAIAVEARRMADENADILNEIFSIVTAMEAKMVVAPPKRRPRKPTKKPAAKKAPAKKKATTKKTTS